MKPFLFAQVDAMTAAARPLTEAEVEIVSGGASEDTQVMSLDPSGGNVVVRDNIKTDYVSDSPVLH